MNAIQTQGVNPRRITTVAELELSRARRAIEHFIYSCSHTMREPLSNISKLCDVIKTTQQDGIQAPAQYLEHIQQTVLRMQSVIAELHAFLANSHNAIAVRSVDVDLMMKALLAEFNETIVSGNINVSLIVDQHVPFYTDESSFRAVMSHLISNAVKFSDEGKIRRDISVIIKISERDCNVNVRDNGIGMQESDLANIFNLFYRGAHERTGSGIGLFVARELVLVLGGEITVSSMPGEGSYFSFEIENLWNAEIRD